MQSMLLRADKASFNNKKKEGYYLGHVFLKQGSSQLNATSAKTYSNIENQLEKAIAFGDSLTKALFETLLNGKNEPLKGQADKITYFPKKQLVRLEGNALLSQGNNTYRAPLIIYDINHQRLLSHKTAQQRSTITFNDKT